MATAQVSEKLKNLSLDLTKTYPRSPRELLAGYVIAGRTLDRCRAMLNGTNGPYNYNGGMDQLFFGFTGIDAEDFKAFVATGASDEEVAVWILNHSKQTERIEIVRWNNELRSRTICDLPDDRQLFMEDYIPANLPKGRFPYVWFDVYDIEEKRL